MADDNGERDMPDPLTIPGQKIVLEIRIVQHDNGALGWTTPVPPHEMESIFYQALQHTQRSILMGMLRGDQGPKILGARHMPRGPLLG